jgi:hypothetical protein
LLPKTSSEKSSSQRDHKAVTSSSQPNLKGNPTGNNLMSNEDIILKPSQTVNKKKATGPEYQKVGFVNENDINLIVEEKNTKKK